MDYIKEEIVRKVSKADHDLQREYMVFSIRRVMLYHIAKVGGYDSNIGNYKQAQHEDEPVVLLP